MKKFIKENWILVAMSLIVIPSLFVQCHYDKPVGADYIFRFSEDQQEEANNYFASHARKIEYEGHRYIFFRDGWSDSSERTAAFAHDANCWCKGVEEETIIVTEDGKN